MMKRARPSVVFHGSQQEENSSKYRLSKEIPNDNDHEHFNNPFPLRELNDRKNKKKENLQKIVRNPLYMGRDLNNEESSHESDLTEKVTDSVGVKSNGSEEAVEAMLSKILELGDKGASMLKRLKEKLGDQKSDVEHKNNNMFYAKEGETKNLMDKRKKREITILSLQDDLNKHDEGADKGKEEVSKIVILNLGARCKGYVENTALQASSLFKRKIGRYVAVVVLVNHCCRTLTKRLQTLHPIKTPLY